MRNKILIAVLFALLLFVCSACTYEEELEERDYAEGDGTLLVLATDLSHPPYAFHRDSSPAGIEVEIASRVAEKLGMQLKILDRPYGEILTAVVDGQADLGASTFNGAALYEEDVVFSGSYLKSQQAILTKIESEIRGPSGLAGAKVGVLAGSSGAKFCAEALPEALPQEYPSVANAVQALSTDKLDAVILDKESAKSYASAVEGLLWLESGAPDEYYAFAVSGANTALLLRVNQALGELAAEGVTEKIISTYVSAE
jgi:polar amino acid transport system substrate-binding protein